MGSQSKIEWTDATWNPVRGCTRISEGCRNCYAERTAARFSGPGRPFDGFVRIQTGIGPQWTGKVELVEKHLADPLRWREPRRIFVNSMSDLFHEALPDEAIDRVFAVMALCPQHTFQVLTKRPERMRVWWRIEEEGISVGDRVPSGKWPLPNVWLGVSVEDQKTADERIPLLLQTPAAVRFVSYEPALGPVNFTRWLPRSGRASNPCDVEVRHSRGIGCPSCDSGLDWIIVGGESGPGARPFDIHWARSTVGQCKAAGVAVFVKQLGSKPMYRSHGDNDPRHLFNGLQDLYCNGRALSAKGGDISEWPHDLRFREMPV